MTLIVDNVEVHILVYALSDMLLLCEKDPEKENGYKFSKVVHFNEKSYVQSKP